MEGAYGHDGKTKTHIVIALVTGGAYFPLKIII